MSSKEQRAELKENIKIGLDMGATSEAIACHIYQLAKAYFETIPQLLDDIDALQAELDAETKRADEAEARAEALERAVRTWNCQMSCINSKPEWICGEHRCENMRLVKASDDSWECEHWQFDTARFTPAT